MDVIPEYLAKYPFLDKATDEIRRQGFEKEDMYEDENVRKRAKTRVISAIKNNDIPDWGSFGEDKWSEKNARIEILSYPLARVLVSVVDEFRVIEKYAEAEALRARRLLTKDIRKGDDNPFEYSPEIEYYDDGSRSGATLTDFEEEFDISINVEDETNLLEKSEIRYYWQSLSSEERVKFLNNVFNTGRTGTNIFEEHVDEISWEEAVSYIKTHVGAFSEEIQFFSLPVTDYLKLIEREDEWHLSQQIVFGGKVVLRYNELFDLLELAIKSKIKEELPIDVPREDKEKIEEDVSDIMAVIPEDMFYEEIDEVNESAFPPVIEEIMRKVREAEHVIHEERFTLASFLINIGMTNEEILDLLEVNSEFGREQTEYQLNHIREQGEGGEEYISPTYEKIKTWGIEWKPDELEKEVSHPLVYYRIKINNIKNEEIESENEKN